MGEHTSGPWGVFLNEDTNQWEIFHDEGRGSGRMLAQIVGEKGRYQANARLIAAAPDLLAACEAFETIERLTDPGAYLRGLDALKVQIRAAIAKARGE